MLRRMPAALLTEWMAYFQLEPFGQARADLRAGLVAAVVANTAFGRKRGAKALKPSDFFANLVEDDPKKAKAMSAEWQEVFAKLRTKLAGGTITKRGAKPPAGNEPKPKPNPRAANKGK